MNGFFLELSIVMVFALVVSLIMQKIRQPLLIGYILTGIVVGPLFFNILSDNLNYDAFSHIGVALLLFIVGLHLNLKLIKEVGFISLVTGLGQVLFTSLFGFFIGILLGFSYTASALLAIGLTFSSTIIIVKLLSDKRDLDTLYGRIAVGFLLVQDLVAVILMMFIGTFLALGSTQGISAVLMKTLFFGVLAIAFTFLFSKYLMPYIMDKIANSQEMLFIFIITWCFALSSLFGFLGFSIEIGALIAGITLASSAYQFEISAKVKPLRDFFIILFFILIGSQMIPDLPAQSLETDSITERLSVIWERIDSLMIPAIVFSIFILIGNPLIVLILMTALGYSSRTGFLAGLTVAQISEFSLILGMMAKNAGFLTSSELSMLTFVGLFTITASTYMIMHGEGLFKRFEHILRKLEKKKLKDAKTVYSEKYDIIIFGYDRIGYNLVNAIERQNKRYLIIDHNPDLIKKLKEKGIHCLYGDASNTELLSELDFKDVKLVISTIPNNEVNILILSSIRKINKHSIVILTANHIDSALELYQLGTDYVIMPHFLGGEYVATLIERYSESFHHFLYEKIKHMKELNERKSFGHEHPKYEK